jgi:SAM-dependent methyltransferase
MAQQTISDEQSEQIVEQLLDATAGAFTVFTVYLGDQLGFYEALADGGPLTPAALADRTDTDERYVREWLEQQTIAGIVTVTDETEPASERQFDLPGGYVEPLTDEDSPEYAVPLTQLIAGTVHPIHDVVDAYRTGGGVPYETYGRDLREGQARINRPSFLGALGTEWLPVLKDVHERLRDDRPARVADIGCGAAYSCIGIAEHYPNVSVDGYDLDEASVELARRNVAEAGLSDRITIHHRDASDPTLDGDYDLVTAFECVHDMADPVGGLRMMRRLAGEDGTVLVVDERVGDAFTAEGNDVEWMMYGWSVLHCLPVGLAEHPSAATGTVMRTDTLREYAEEAGFDGFEVLPIEDFFFRFYRLDPESSER